MRFKFAFNAAVILCALTPAAASSEIIEFSWRTTSPSHNSGVNIIPFGNVSDARYQQIYAGSGFGSAPISISSLAFQNYGIGYMPTVFSQMLITISTTSAAVGALGTAFDANHGTQRTEVFNGHYRIDTIGQTLGDYNLVFAFDQAFEYDPRQGNLLVEFRMTHESGSGAPAFASFNTGQSSRLWSFLPNYTTGIADNFSLNTQFQVTSGVPEPATWAMMMLGFGAMGAAVRRRAVKTNAHIGLV